LEQVADFKSESAADIISESVADLRRNQQDDALVADPVFQKADQPILTDAAKKSRTSASSM
jgi:hypothetical protein